MDSTTTIQHTPEFLTGGEVLILEKNATIKVTNLPAVEGVPVLPYQLFYNLISNSIKFSKENVPGTITIESSVTDLEGNRFAKIVLSDNGIGFEQEHAEKNIYNVCSFEFKRQR